MDTAADTATDIATDTAMDTAPLSESAWQELETGSARLLPGPGASRAAGNDYLAGLWAAVVAEFRCLHSDLALFPRAPASFLFQGKAIVRTMRILERGLRPGQEVQTGPWRLGREDGRNEDDQVFVQYTISHAAGGAGARQTNLVLIKQPSPTSSSFYPLPFETAVLEESDATGRSFVQAIERDESDAVFVGSLTTKGEKPTGSPTDFGVLLRQDGTQEWSGGSLARQSLVESARLAAQARIATERAAARGLTAAPADAVPTARPVAAEPAREEPRRTTRPRPRRGESAPSAEAASEQPGLCAACGVAVPKGADFCSACGARIEARPVAPRRAPSAAAKCPRCQAALAPEARFCPSCGASTSAPPKARAPEPAPAPANCRKCGSTLPPGARFCSACGEPSAPAAPVTRRAECAQCGSPLRSDAQFCASCGATVSTVVGMAAGPFVGSVAPSGSATCRSCGVELRAGARFCRRCGAPQAPAGR